MRSTRSQHWELPGSLTTVREKVRAVTEGYTSRIKTEHAVDHRPLRLHVDHRTGITMSSPDLELNIHLTLAATSYLPARVPARFSYVSADPYAVQVSLHVTPDQVVHWTFARELLDQGMRTAAGLGDVKIAPIEPPLGQRFSIELEPPGGYARLEGPVAPVQAWIAKTYEVVPAGSETVLLDIDRFLEEFSGR
jgi:hypothetical protein